jgi:uncharacterized protein (DUF433 family)
MIKLQNTESELSDSFGKSLVRKTPGVCGGNACIGNSRITVWLLVGLKKDGLSDADLLKGYPSLTPSDLTAAWEYYRLNPEEIEESIKANERDDD